MKKYMVGYILGGIGLIFVTGLFGFIIGSADLQKEELFGVKEGMMLSENQTEQDGEIPEAPVKTPRDPGQDTSRGETLRMPEQDNGENADSVCGTLVETGRNYKTYELPDGTYQTVFTSYSNTYMDGTEEKLIDNTLVSENSVDGEVYVNKENDMEVSLPAGENEDKAVTVGIEETEAVLRPEDGIIQKRWFRTMPFGIMMSMKT